MTCLLFQAGSPIPRVTLVNQYCMWLHVLIHTVWMEIGPDRLDWSEGEDMPSAYTCAWRIVSTCSEW